MKYDPIEELNRENAQRENLALWYLFKWFFFKFHLWIFFTTIALIILIAKYGEQIDNFFQGVLKLGPTVGLFLVLGSGYLIYRMVVKMML